MNLRDFDGGGGGDYAIAEKFRYERKQTILVRELAIEERSECAAEINP